MPRTGDKDQYIFFSVVSHPYRDLSSCFSSWAKSTSTHPSFKLPKLCTYFLHVLSRLLLLFFNLIVYTYLNSLLLWWNAGREQKYMQVFKLLCLKGSSKIYV